MADILAAILNFSKSSMMPAQHHLDYLTLKHHPTTKLSIKTYIQNINYRNIDHLKKTHFGGHIGGHFMILYEVSLSLLKNMTAAHYLTESTFKTYIHNTST